MSTFNENIKKLTCFIDQFDDFKSEIQKQIDDIKRAQDGKGKSADDFEVLKNKISQLNKKIDKSQLNRVEIDSARRTFGEEVGLLKSHIDKIERSLNKRVDTFDLSGEIKALNKKVSDIKQPFDHSKSIAEIKRELKSLKIPLDTSSQVKELERKVKKLESVEHVDSSAQVKALEDRLEKIPAQKDYSSEIKKLERKIDEVSKKQLELDNKTVDVAFSKKLKSLSDEVKSIKNTASKKQPVEFVTAESFKAAIESLTKSVSSINKAVSNFDVTSDLKPLKSEIEKTNSAVKKLQSELNSIKSLFED